MQKLKISITAHDVSESEWFRINNPILFVLQNTTGTLWQMRDDGSVIEAMAPYRSGQLSTEPRTRWQHYLTTGQMPPFEFDLELHESRPQQAQDGLSQDGLQNGHLNGQYNGLNHGPASRADESESQPLLAHDVITPEVAASQAVKFKAC
jgi:hypothetical protein